MTSEKDQKDQKDQSNGTTTTGSAVNGKKKLGLLDAVKALNNISFSFVLKGTEKTQDGQTIAVLGLDEPRYVRGSQRIDMGDGTSKNLEVQNATEVKILEADMTEDFHVEEDGAGGYVGTYEGSNLVLDVSKNFDVWMRRESFAVGGKKLRQNNLNNRVTGIRERLGAGQATPATI